MLGNRMGVNLSFQDSTIGRKMREMKERKDLEAGGLLGLFIDI